MGEGGADLLPSPHVPDFYRVVAASRYHNTVYHSRTRSKLCASHKIRMNSLQVHDDFASLRRPHPNVFIVTCGEHVLIDRNVHIDNFISAFVSSYLFCIHLVPVSHRTVIRTWYNLLSTVVEQACIHNVSMARVLQEFVICFGSEKNNIVQVKAWGKYILIINTSTDVCDPRLKCHSW